MMKLQKNNIEFYIFILLFIVIPFVQTTEGNNPAAARLVILPSFVREFSSIIRWILIIASIFIFAIKFKSTYWKYIQRTNKLLVLFYGVFLLYSLISFTDLPRYIGLFLEALVLPVLTVAAFKGNERRILKFFSYYILILALLGLILNGSVIIAGFRFQGLMDNPNMYGMISAFWLSIIFLKMSVKKPILIDYLIVLLLLITVFLSGSRNGLIASIIVILFFYFNNFHKFILPLIFALLLLYLVMVQFNLDFLIDRYLIQENVVSASGREEVWEQAKYYIKKSLLLGNGMNAPLDLVKSGNIHNCYLRMLLTMGVIFTTLALLFYFSMVIDLLIKKNKITRSILGFIISFSFANLFEDFFVGVGSVMMVYFFFSIGIIVFYILKNKEEMYDSY